LNKQTFYYGTCKAKKNKTIPTVFGQIQPKKIPKNLPKSETFAE
jgi:hypothetical protein